MYENLKLYPLSITTISISCNDFTDGRVEVLKEGKQLAQFGGPTVFGELAILYKCPRTASILGWFSGFCRLQLDLDSLKSESASGTRNVVLKHEKCVIQLPFEPVDHSFRRFRSSKIIGGIFKTVRLLQARLIGTNWFLSH